MTAIENGWTYELQRLRAENAALRAALEHAEAVIHASFATPTTMEGRTATALMNRIRAALAARDDKGE